MRKFELGPSVESVFDAGIDCPTCGFNYNHINKVEVLGNRDGLDDPRSMLAITMEGGDLSARVVDFSEELMPIPDTRGRGLELCIHMNCESGHDWLINLSFHKGSSYLTCWHKEPKHDTKTKDGEKNGIS